MQSMEIPRLEEYDNPALLEVVGDAEEVFGYRHNVRPQDRAHAYLGSHALMRDHSESAMYVAARDLCYRAFSAGMQVQSAPDDSVLETLADKAYELYEEIYSKIPKEAE